MCVCACVLKVKCFLFCIPSRSLAKLQYRAAFLHDNFTDHNSNQQLISLKQCICVDLLLSSSTDVRDVHGAGQGHAPGQASALAGTGVSGLPHRPQPSGRVPQPLVGRHRRLHHRLGHRHLPGESTASQLVKLHVDTIMVFDI